MNKSYGFFIIRKHKPTTIWHKVWGLKLFPCPKIIYNIYYGNGKCLDAEYSINFSMEY